MRAKRKPNMNKGQIGKNAANTVHLHFQDKMKRNSKSYEWRVRTVE